MNVLEVLGSSINRLSFIQRYSSLDVRRQENVAEHVFFCTLYSHLLAKDLLVRGYDIDPHIAIEKALYHDFEEALTGDIIRSFKYATPALREEIKKAGELRMGELIPEFGDAGAGIWETWKHAKDGLEGKVVAFADLLCCVSYCRQELLGGNKHMMGVVREIQVWLKNYQDDEHFGKYYLELYPNDDPEDILRELEARVPA